MTEAISTTLFNSVLQKVNINVSVNLNELFMHNDMIYGIHQ
jgi:hypothetical protein